MSNTVAWRAKPRTSKPNSRQKRNGLFLDGHPVCQQCWNAHAKQAHHVLGHGFAARNHPLAMRALCEPCHVRHHRPVQDHVQGLALETASTSRPRSTRWRIACDRSSSRPAANSSIRPSVSSGNLTPTRGVSPVGGRPLFFCGTVIDIQFSVSHKMRAEARLQPCSDPDLNHLFGRCYGYEDSTAGRELGQPQHDFAHQ